MHNTRTLLLVSITVLSIFTLPVSAINWHFPTTINIPSGMNWHFGTLTISTSATAIHITVWFINNWVNYTVDSLGIQQIFNDTLITNNIVPTVWIDGSSQPQNIAMWTYDGRGLITVVAAHSSVAIQFSSSAYRGHMPPSSPLQIQVSIQILAAIILIVAVSYLVLKGKGKRTRLWRVRKV